MAPLWLHGSLSAAPEANVAPGLLAALQGQGIETTPEGLLHYVYAVLNSPWFRQAYEGAPVRLRPHPVRPRPEGLCRLAAAWRAARHAPPVRAP